jgi:hypothetical protein
VSRYDSVFKQVVYLSEISSKLLSESSVNKVIKLNNLVSFLYNILYKYVILQDYKSRDNRHVMLPSLIKRNKVYTYKCSLLP